jgi:hypothetical protein
MSQSPTPRSPCMPRVRTGVGCTKVGFNDGGWPAEEFVLTVAIDSERRSEIKVGRLGNSRVHDQIRDVSVVAEIDLNVLLIPSLERSCPIQTDTCISEILHLG